MLHQENMYRRYHGRLKEIALIWDNVDAQIKAEIIAALVEEGVSFEMYENFSTAEKEQVEEVVEDELD